MYQDHLDSILGKYQDSDSAISATLSRAKSNLGHYRKTTSEILAEPATQRLVRHFLLLLGIPSSDLDDEQQNVYVKLLENDYFSKFNPLKGSLSNYLYYGVRSSTSVYRARHRRDKILIGTVPDAAYCTDLFDQLVSREALLDFKTFLAGQPRLHKAIFQHYPYRCRVIRPEGVQDAYLLRRNKSRFCKIILFDGRLEVVPSTNIIRVVVNPRYQSGYRETNSITPLDLMDSLQNRLDIRDIAHKYRVGVNTIYYWLDRLEAYFYTWFAQSQYIEPDLRWVGMSKKCPYCGYLGLPGQRKKRKRAILKKIGSRPHWFAEKKSSKYRSAVWCSACGIGCLDNVTPGEAIKDKFSNPFPWISPRT